MVDIVHRVRTTVPGVLALGALLAAVCVVPGAPTAVTPAGSRPAVSASGPVTLPGLHPLTDDPVCHYCWGM